MYSPTLTMNWQYPRVIIHFEFHVDDYKHAMLVLLGTIEFTVVRMNKKFIPSVMKETPTYNNTLKLKHLLFAHSAWC